MDKRDCLVLSNQLALETTASGSEEACLPKPWRCKKERQ
jgi:hypothetical protein